MELCDILCPISQQILLNPYVTNTGILWEKQLINQYIQTALNTPTSLKCPLTRVQLSMKIIESNLTMKIIKGFIKSNPKYSDQQWSGMDLDTDLIWDEMKIWSWIALILDSPIQLANPISYSDILTQTKFIPGPELCINQLKKLIQNTPIEHRILNMPTINYDHYHFFTNGPILQILTDLKITWNNICFVNKLICQWAPQEFIIPYTTNWINNELNLNVESTFDNYYNNLLWMICRNHTDTQVVKWALSKWLELTSTFITYKNPDNPLGWISSRTDNIPLIKWAIIECARVDISRFKILNYDCGYHSNMELLDWIITARMDLGLDLNTVDSDGKNLLHSLCNYQSHELVRWGINKWIELDLQLDMVDNAMKTIIHYICSCQINVDLIKWSINKWIELGLQLDMEDIRGNNCLFELVAFQSDLFLIEWFTNKWIDQGLSFTLDTSTGTRRNNVLNSVCYYGLNSEIIKWVAGKCAQLESKDWIGWNALCILCGREYFGPELIKWALTYWTSLGLDLNLLKFYNDFTPLDMVCMRYDSESEFELIKWTLTFWNKSELFINNCMNPIICICRQPRPLELFQLLINYWIELGFNSKFNTQYGENDMGLIHYICRFQTDQVIYWFIKKWIELNLNLELETKNKWKPIHFICYYNKNIQLIKWVLTLELDKSSYVKRLNNCDYNLLDLIELRDDIDPYDRTELINLLK
jgi:hypothetical protein